jgi:NAD(P)-dependent dehydrogenase (short-subunit alcohol dehydrogenase family)
MVREILPKAHALASPRASAPTRSLGEAIEVARAVLFLLSDESRYINGVALSVDNAITVA